MKTVIVIEDWTMLLGDSSKKRMECFGIPFQ